MCQKILDPLTGLPVCGKMIDLGLGTSVGYGASGKPLIYITDLGLMSMNEAVTTVFHEVMHMEIINYFLLVASILGIFIMVFKIKGNLTFRLLGVVLCSNGILICLARLLSIKHILNYPIGVLGIISYIILTNMAWRIRKVPGKKFAAYFWLIGTPLMIAFIIIASTFFK